jgi:hypothetical protein
MHGKFRRKIVLPLAALALLTVLANVGLACPTCKDNLAADPAAANIIRGYYYSILFMMSMPFLILGSLCTYFYWKVCTAKAAGHTAQSASHTAQAASHPVQAATGTAQLASGAVRPACDLETAQVATGME